MPEWLREESIRFTHRAKGTTQQVVLILLSILQQVLGNMLSIQAQGFCWQECDNSDCFDVY